MILVVGATGMVGSEICLRLSGRGEKVRALVRTTSSTEKMALLRGRGVEVCVGGGVEDLDPVTHVVIRLPTTRISSPLFPTTPNRHMGNPGTAMN